MKESRVLVVLFALLVGLGVPQAPAEAELCTIDAVPAATLLLPYFEINLRKKRSKLKDTIVSIGNVNAAPALAHVTFWTDLSVPTINFDIFLTGWDVQAFSLADLFFFGELPDTFETEMASLTTPPNDATRSKIVHEENDACTMVGGTFDLKDFQDAHSGRAAGDDDLCYGQRKSGRVARGYITIDNVSACSLLFPNDPGYFASDESEGVANNLNQLWGDYFVVGGGQLQADHLVSIESIIDPATFEEEYEPFEPGDYTFYGRYLGFDATDQREPLATTWAARYFSTPSKTYYQVWRDSLVPAQAFRCGNKEESGSYPLDQTQIVAFDEQEDFVGLFIDEDAFKAESQMVRVGKSKFPTPFDSGWTFLNLNHSGGIAQSYVTIRQDNKSRRSVYPAIALTNACGPVDQEFEE